MYSPESFQSKRADLGGKSSDMISYEECLDQVRNKIKTAQDKLLAEKKYSSTKYEGVVADVIDEYINEVSEGTKVLDFIDENGKSNSSLLKDRLKSYYLSYGVIDPYMKDESICEIKILDYTTILIEENGEKKPALDTNGMPVRFKTLQEYDHFVADLLLQSDQKLSKDCTYLDAITREGYRVAVIGPEANVRDKHGSFRHPITTVVIRKQRSQDITVKESIEAKYPSLSRGIGRLMELIARGWLSMFVFGETSAGKTVFLQMVANLCDPITAISATGNPSELNLRKRNAMGFIINNVIHTEITEWSSDDAVPKGFPNSENLAKANLRVTPDIIITEEARSSADFKRIILQGLTGHCEWATGHAGSVLGGVSRIKTEALQGFPNVDADTVTDMMGSFLRIIAVMGKHPDGTRKLNEIAEINGVKSTPNGKELNVNMLYKFFRSDTKNTSGGLHRRVEGKHYRVGSLSPELIEILHSKGFVDSQLEFLTTPLDESGMEEDVYIYDPIFKEDSEVSEVN